MSVNHYVYLGPYLECEYLVVEAERFKKACDNSDCHMYNFPFGATAVFCSGCGQPLSMIPYITMDPSVDAWLLADEIDEALSIVPTEYIRLDKFVHIWIPNKARSEPREFYVDPLTDLQVTPLDILPDEERAWLSCTFEQEIDVLRRHYERCDIMWGLIVYAY